MAGRDTEELQRMIITKKTGEINLAQIEELLQKEDLDSKYYAMEGITHVIGRDAYYQLIDYIRNEINPAAITAVILAMGSVRTAPETKDCRFLFPLVNLYNLADEITDNQARHQRKTNILLALSNLQDPRAIDFLNQTKETEQNQNLRQIIDNCIASTDLSKKFEYAFTQADEPNSVKIESQRSDAEKTDKHRLQIRHYSDIPALPIHFENLRVTDGMLGPLTYTIDEKERLFIGTDIEEHVITARGANVIAAGEMTFAQNGDAWEIVELNNRSNGYFPSRNTYSLVAKVLDAAGIKHPDQFTYKHPRDGFFADDFLSMFPFHPKYEEEHFGKKRRRLSNLK